MISGALCLRPEWSNAYKCDLGNLLFQCLPGVAGQGPTNAEGRCLQLHIQFSGVTVSPI